MAAAVLLLSGCATQNHITVSKQTEPVVTAPIRLEPGPIAVACPREPAEFSFDKADGRIADAGDAAGNSARAVMQPPFAEEPILDVIYSPFGLLMAPFGAAYGALTVGNDKMSAANLSESEWSLTKIMAQMADQKYLRDQVLKKAGENTYRRLVPAESAFNATQALDAPATTLQTKVEELRLERTGSSDTSYSLLIKASVRLTRASDGETLYEQPLEYRSGKGLFVDWTHPESFKAVAETGYRELAQRIAGQILIAGPDRPLALGAGYQSAAARSRLPSGSSLVATDPRSSAPVTSRIRYVTDEPGSIGVYSTASLVPISVQRPLSKDEAVSAAVENVERSLDGLQDSRNIVVQISACAVALPMSLWQQTVGAIRGVPAKKLQSAKVQLDAASHQTLPHNEIARQVAFHLAPQTSQPVLLVNNPFPIGRSGKPSPGPRLVASSTENLEPATALEIHMERAALAGESGINSSLALCVEARVTLRRVLDGAELYTCPVHYLSESRTYTQWAAHDARLFREELQRCYHDVGSAIADRISETGRRAPGRTLSPTVATK
jgi:hypothetical protein